MDYALADMAALAARVLLICSAAGLSFMPFSEGLPAIEWMTVTNEVSCRGKADGVYTHTASFEGSFFRCQNQRLVEQARCDPLTGLCTSTLQVQTDCTNSSEGFFTAPHTLCRVYYQCRGGVRQDFTCPVDSYFDFKSQFCVRSGGVCRELICTGRVNGRFADTSHDCRRSYVCEGGLLKGLASCPAGTRYNGTSCESADRVKCSTDKSSVAVRILPTDPCADRPNGFQTQQDETCRGYLLCHSGQTIAKLRCAPGEYFNGVVCEPAKNTTCVSYCAGKTDGYITDLRRQCRGYVNCVDGRVVEELSCRDGSLFNGKSCVPALLYHCPLPVKKNACSKLKDGYHQDYMSGCKDYFYCHQGQVLLRSTCRDGKLWNGSDCIPPGDFVCQGPELWPGCSGREDGLYPDLSPSSRCRFYDYCADGRRVRLRCQKGLVFNGKTCVKENSFACPVLDFDCFDKADGYYLDSKSNCRSYFFCSDGQKLTYICPESQVFNGSECVDQRDYTCSSALSTNPCSNKTNGYHGDESTGCHKYMYCLQGVLITSFECPDGNVFDGKKCVPFKIQTCINSKLNCENAEDGLYSDPNSQCTSYFKCLGRKKTKTFTCREGKVFNGAKCVDYICPSKSEQLRRKEGCVGRLGFFQDYESKCNKYYFCINGVKTILSCKRGQVFNGELCTNEKNYTCPTEEVNG